MLDLAGKGRFALFTGIGGEVWKQAAEEVSARTGVPVRCYVIGPGQEVLDLYDDWSRLSEVRRAGACWYGPTPTWPGGGRPWPMIAQPSLPG